MEKEYNKCPICDSEDIEELIDYRYGNKICAGYSCNNCDWEIIF